MPSMAVAPLKLADGEWAYEFLFADVRMPLGDFGEAFPTSRSLVSTETDTHH